MGLFKSLKRIVKKFASFISILLMLVLAAIAWFLLRDNLTGFMITLNIIALCIMGGSTLFSFAVRFRKYNRIAEDLENATSDIQNSDGSMTSELKFRETALKECYDKFLEDSRKYNCDISDYINEDLLDSVINKSVSDQLSGIMTGIGLLGTFIGLIVGLRNFSGETEQLAAGIPMLLNGMKTAFLTSVFGVIYSIYYNLFYKSIYKDGIEALHNFYSAFYSNIAEDPDVKNINKIIEYQKTQIDSVNAQNELLVKLPEVMSASISKAMVNEISSSLTPTLNKLDDLLTEFVNQAISSQQENLENLVDKFISSMNEALQDKFTELGDTIEKTCEVSKQNNELMQAVVSDILKQEESLVGMNKSLDEALNNIGRYESLLNQYNSSLLDNNTETQGLIRELNSIQTETINGINNLRSDISDSVGYIKGVQELVVTAYTDTVNSIGAMKNGVNEVFKETAREVSEMQTELKNSVSETNQIMQEGIKQYFIETATTVSEMQSDLINNVADSSKEMHEEVKNVIVDATELLTSNVAESAKSMHEEVKKAMTETAETVVKLQNDMNLSVKGIYEEVKNMILTTASSIAAIQGDFQKSFTGVSGELKNVTETLANSLEQTGNFVVTMKEMVEKNEHIIESNSNTLNGIDEKIRILTESYSKTTENTIEQMQKQTGIFNNSTRGLISELQKSGESFTAQCSDRLNALMAAYKKVSEESLTNLKQELNAVNNLSGGVLNELKNIRTKIGSECSELERSLGKSLTTSFDTFDRNLAEITSHLNSSIKGIQEVVDSIQPSLYKTINQMTETLDKCAEKLNNETTE